MSLSRRETADKSREPGVIKPFAEIWGTDELLVSFDGGSLCLPGPMQPVDPAPW